MNTKFYDLLGVVLRPAYKLLFPGSKVTGEENIPAEGGFVICANHIHWNDCLYFFYCIFCCFFYRSCILSIFFHNGIICCLKRWV